MFEFPHTWKGLARSTDPDTSHKAAESMNAGSLELLIYYMIKAFPKGCISDDVERMLPHIRSHSITPRFSQLIKKGFIVDTGERRTASSGRTQRVLMAATNRKD